MWKFVIKQQLWIFFANVYTFYIFHWGCCLEEIFLTLAFLSFCCYQLQSTPGTPMPQQRTGILRKSRDSWQLRSKSKKQNLVIFLSLSLLVALLSYFHGLKSRKTCVKSNEHPAVITINKIFQDRLVFRFSFMFNWRGSKFSWNNIRCFYISYDNGENVIFFTVCSSAISNHHNLKESTFLFRDKKGRASKISSHFASLVTATYM